MEEIKCRSLMQVLLFNICMSLDATMRHESTCGRLLCYDLQ